MAARRGAPSKAKKKVTPAPVRRALHYKVVEISNVDETTLERTINEWVPRGWAFDGVQFAMRESSKRPSMGFVYFTREGEVLEDEPVPTQTAFRENDEADRHLRRVVLGGELSAEPVQDAWSRLQSMANEADE